MRSSVLARKKNAVAERPFVDFYMLHGVIPTRQDISNLERHFQRRSALYRNLGVIPSYLEGRSVIEFGPGSGHNHVHTLSLKPARTVLVDANKASLQSTAELVGRHKGSTDCEIIDCDIERFSTKERFDLVLCEGVVPTQNDPVSFTRKVASFAKPGGVLIITCADPVSLLPEILRRYVANRIVPDTVSFDERVTRLTAYFTPDLKTLPNMSRKYEDWVIDTLIHRWTGRLYSMAQALEALEGISVPHGSSPRFLTDWRWYKDIHGKARFDLKQNLIDYWSQAHAMLDFRSEVTLRSPKANQSLAHLAAQIYERVYDVEKQGKPYSPAAISRDVRKVAAHIRSPMPSTARALDEFARVIGRVGPGRANPFRLFHGLWGRGQQYLSFIIGE